MISFYNYQTMDSHNRRLSYGVDIKEGNIFLYKTTCSFLDDFCYEDARRELNCKVYKNKVETIIPYTPEENPGKKALEYIYSRNKKYNPDKNIKEKRKRYEERLRTKNLSFWEKIRNLFR